MCGLGFLAPQFSCPELPTSPPTLWCIPSRTYLLPTVPPALRRCFCRGCDRGSVRLGQLHSRTLFGPFTSLSVKFPCRTVLWRLWRSSPMTDRRICRNPLGTNFLRVRSKPSARWRRRFCRRLISSLWSWRIWAASCWAVLQTFFRGHWGCWTRGTRSRSTSWSFLYLLLLTTCTVGYEFPGWCTCYTQCIFDGGDLCISCWRSWWSSWSRPGRQPFVRQSFAHRASCSSWSLRRSLPFVSVVIAGLTSSGLSVRWQSMWLLLATTCILSWLSTSGRYPCPLPHVVEGKKLRKVREFLS